MPELLALRLLPAWVPEPGLSGGVELSPSRNGGVERGSHVRASCPPLQLSCPPLNEGSLDLAAVGDAASEADASGAASAAAVAAAAASAAAAVTRLEVRREDFLDARSFLAAPRSRSSPGSIAPSVVGDLLSSPAGSSSLCIRAAASSTDPPPRGLRLKAPRKGGGGRSPRWDGESTCSSDWQDSKQPRSSRSSATTGGGCGAFCRRSKMDIPRRAMPPTTYYATWERVDGVRARPPLETGLSLGRGVRVCRSKRCQLFWGYIQRLRLACACSSSPPRESLSMIHSLPALLRRTVLKAQFLFFATVTGERNAVRKSRLVLAVTVLVVSVVSSSSGQLYRRPASVWRESAVNARQAGGRHSQFRPTATNWWRNSTCGLYIWNHHVNPDQRVSKATASFGHFFKASMVLPRALTHICVDEKSRPPVPVG